MTKDWVVVASDLVKTYKMGEVEVNALCGASVSIARGEVLSIMGPSGSGKSTLLHCLAGLDRVTSGQVFLGDDEISAMNEKQLTLVRRDKIGFVFQSYNLVPTLTGLENITLPLALAGRKPDQAWLDQIIETRFVNRNLAAVEALDLGNVDIDADHIVAGFRQASTGDQSHVTGSENRNVHASFHSAMGRQPRLPRAIASPKGGDYSGGSVECAVRETVRSSLRNLPTDGGDRDSYRTSRK